MNKAIYLPALAEQFGSLWKRGLKYKGKDGKEYDMKCFTENSHFNYPYGLQSIYYAKEGVAKGCDNKDGNTFRNLIGYPKEALLVTDSAGFQIASFKKKGEKCNITAIDSLRYQEANGNIMMQLDVPPNLDGKPSYHDFKEALEESKKNFKVFEDNRKNFDADLYNVLHGETLTLLEEWYNEVKDFKNEGWAIGIKPPFDPMLQALGFLFLLEKGEYNKESCHGIHFFGTSGKHVVPTLVYCASKIKKENFRVTYDSSSYNIGSIFRTYYLPFDIGPHICFGDKFKRENPELKELPCCCPVCRTIKDINELNTTDIYAGTLISLHNMYQYIQYNELLNSIVYNKERFIEYLNTINISDKCLKSIEFIDFALENGLKQAVKKYEEWLKPEEINKAKQVSIFHF